MIATATESENFEHIPQRESFYHLTDNKTAMSQIYSSDMKLNITQSITMKKQPTGNKHTAKKNRFNPQNRKQNLLGHIIHKVRIIARE